ncbi:MAG: sodium:calcium antiporter [bacterium]|nr:sodium:calcium antiporter [bacterium]
MILEIVLLLIGLLLLAFSSDKTVDVAARLAATANIPPLIIGIVVLSMGTSLPEISNSIFSNISGHPEINVGDVFGSALSQITLIFGLAVLIGGKVAEGRRDVLLLGGCAIMGAMLALFVVESGEITLTNALFLIVSYCVLIFISNKYTVKEYAAPHAKEAKRFWPWKDRFIAFGKLALFLLGVVAGAILVVNSTVALSMEIGIDTYLVSFFVVAIGTSLPELFVAVAAIRRGQDELAMGNILGSNITDTTLALAAGPLIASSVLPDVGLAMGTGTYMVVASMVVVGLFAWRKKIDRLAAIVLIGIYLASYFFLF